MSDDTNTASTTTPTTARPSLTTAHECNIYNTLYICQMMLQPCNYSEKHLLGIGEVIPEAGLWLLRD